MKYTLKERYIPKDYKEYRTLHMLKENPVAVVYSQEVDGKIFAIAYVGKAKNHQWHLIFRSREELDEKIDTLFGNLQHREEEKKERRAKRKNALLGIKVGDLLYDSWGYDQTNVDFYQVIEKKGQTMKISKINGKQVAPGGCSMSAYVGPVKDSFLNDEYYPDLVKRSFSMPCGYLSLTTEDEQHYSSWYA